MVSCTIIAHLFIQPVALDTFKNNDAYWSRVGLSLSQYYDIIKSTWSLLGKDSIKIKKDCSTWDECQNIS